ATPSPTSASACTPFPPATAPSTTCSCSRPADECAAAVGRGLRPGLPALHGPAWGAARGDLGAVALVGAPGARAATLVAPEGVPVGAAGDHHDPGRDQRGH